MQSYQKQLNAKQAVEDQLECQLMAVKKLTSGKSRSKLRDSLGSLDNPSTEQEIDEWVSKLKEAGENIRQLLGQASKKFFMEKFLTESSLKVGCLHKMEALAEAKKKFAKVTDVPLKQGKSEGCWEKLVRKLNSMANDVEKNKELLSKLGGGDLDTSDPLAVYNLLLLSRLNSMDPNHLSTLFEELIWFLSLSDITWRFPLHLQFEAQVLSSDFYLASFMNHKKNKSAFDSGFAKKLAQTILSEVAVDEPTSSPALTPDAYDFSMPAVSTDGLYQVTQESIKQLYDSLRVAESVKDSIKVSDVLSQKLGIFTGEMAKDLIAKSPQYSESKEEVSPVYITLLDTISKKSAKLAECFGLKPTPTISVEFITTRFAQALPRDFYKLSHGLHSFRLIWAREEPKTPYFMIDEYVEGDAERTVSDNHLTFFRVISDSQMDKMPHYTLQFSGAQGGKKVHIYDMGIRIHNAITGKEPNYKAPAVFSALAKMPGPGHALKAVQSAVVSYEHPSSGKGLKLDTNPKETVIALLANDKTEPGYAHMCSLVSSFLGVYNMSFESVQTDLYERARSGK